jgi:hypothetical protein
LPKESGCDSDGIDKVAVLQNTTVYKNGYNDVCMVGIGGNGAIILDGLLAVDNARTYQTSADVFYSGVYNGLPTGLTEVVCNAVIAQYTNNNIHSFAIHKLITLYRRYNFHQIIWPVMY